MKKRRSVKDSIHFNTQIVLFIIFAILITLCYGGFFESAILVSAFFVCIISFFKGFKITFTKSQGIFFIFSVWYFICSFKNGFVIEYIIKGLLPFVIFFFWIYISNMRDKKEKIIDIITEASAWIGIIAIIHCIALSIKNEHFIRLSFPFDYSNVCGIYFAVCYFNAELSKSKFLNNIKYIFLIALIFTLSVGSILIFIFAITYSFIKEKKYKHIIIEFILLFVFAIIFKNRIIESSATFLERLLHIYDGIICIKQNPVTGIGAGCWQNAKNYYQTGFYIANTIHSSVVSVGVSSGIIGLLLFAYVFVSETKKVMQSKNKIIPFMILLHAFIDFSLSFIAIDLILILSLDIKEAENKFFIKQSYKKLLTAVLFSFLMFLSVGYCKSVSFQNDIINGKSEGYVIEKFDESFYIKASINSQKSLAAFLYSEKSDAKASFKNYRYMPIEMILQKAIYSKEGDEYILQNLEKQPYNTVLRDYIANEFSNDTAKKAISIVEKSHEKASFLGKILYKLKGENVWKEQNFIYQWFW